MRAGPFRWGVALATLALAIGVLALPVQAAWEPPACPWTADAGTYLVNFGQNGYQYIRSDRSEPEAQTPHIAVNIPAGTYDITVYSYDDHDPDKPTQTDQTHEQWYLVASDGVGPDYHSGVTGDLADTLNTREDTIATGAVFGQPITSAWAYHAFYPNAQTGVVSPNSITPICAKFTAQVPPTTTTTTTPSSTTTTTSPPSTTTTTSSLLGSIGDFVWNDANDNGVQDADEVGIAGVTVNLYDGAGTLLASMVTDAGGHYRFGGLVSGDYVVEFVLPTTAWEFSPAGQGSDDALDSDPGADGRTGVITLAAGAGDLTNDAGMYFPAQVEPTSAVRPTQETLPFTGGSSTGAGGVGIGLVLLGGLILLVLRKEPVDG
ncbi:MAG: SdrD B-like domain-containing protein [Acidimicrobiia bacterium]